MMYNNFKAVFQIFIFTCIRAIDTIYSTYYNLNIPHLNFGFVYIHNWDFPQVNISFIVIKQQIINDVHNFKAVFQIFIFTCIRAIDHNIQYLLEFKMSICQLWLCVHNWDFPQVNISFSILFMMYNNFKVVFQISIFICIY